MTPALFRPAASADLEEAFAWYEAQHPGLGQAFRDAVDAAPVVASILGQEDRIGRWVGCANDAVSKHAGVLHRLTILDDPSSGFLGVVVQLFSDSEAPEYLVVVRAPQDAKRAAEHQ